MVPGRFGKPQPGKGSKVARYTNALEGKTHSASDCISGCEALDIMIPYVECTVWLPGGEGAGFEERRELGKEGVVG